MSYSQTALEELRDFTELQLLPFFQKYRLLTPEEDATYSHSQVMQLVVGAYWRGVGDHVRDHRTGELARAVHLYVKRKEELNPSSASL